MDYKTQSICQLRKTDRMSPKSAPQATLIKTRVTKRSQTQFMQKEMSDRILQIVYLFSYI